MEAWPNRLNFYKRVKAIALGSVGTEVSEYLCIAKNKHVAIKRMEISGNSAYISCEIDTYERFMGQSHENIVQYHQHFADKKYHYFVMELMDYSLQDLIKKHIGRFRSPAPLNKRVIATILQNVLKGIQHLHGSNPPILHRDIKPANILLSDAGAVKISDFDAKGVMDDVRKTEIGTRPYMAPEATKPPEGGYNVKVDIWSFGIVAFLMCTRETSIRDKRMTPKKRRQTILTKHLPEFIRDCKAHGFDENEAENFQTVIKDCLELDPNKRPSAGELLGYPLFSTLPLAKEQFARMLKSESDVKKKCSVL